MGYKPACVHTNVPFFDPGSNLSEIRNQMKEPEMHTNMQMQIL